MVFSQMKRIDQDQLRDNNTRSLEVHSLPAIIFQVVNPQHSGIHHLRELGEKPFEIREERRIIQSPFRGLLVVPFLYRQAVGNS
jgi:hypothetical protein